MRFGLRRAARLLTAPLAGVVLCTGLAGPAAGKGTVTIGNTETIASFKHYADSSSLGYGIWCQVLGCLGIYDFAKADYVGLLAESWDIDKQDPTIWTFHLKHGVKRQYDGKEFGAADVVHSFNRINNDPQTMQKQNVAPVKEMIAVDPYTVKVVTKTPTASLLEYLFDRMIISSADLYEKYGARDADRKSPWGWGPYKLKELVIGQRIVLEKDETSPAAKPENPDTLIFTIMRESEQRVTALLNNEIQIAQFIPPHLAQRVSQASHAKLVSSGSVGIMILAMSPKYNPWDNVKLRRAVCEAIDHDAIIKNVLVGKGDRLHGPIDPGHYPLEPA